MMKANPSRTSISKHFLPPQSNDGSVVRNVDDLPVRTSDVLLMLIVMLISGGVTVHDLVLSFALQSIAIVLAAFKLGTRQKKQSRSSVNAVVALVLIFSVFLIKYLFWDGNQAIDKYGLYFVNIFTAILVLMVYVRRAAYLLKVIHVALLITLLHALLSFFLWFFVKNHLHYIEPLKTFTFNYVFFYGHAENLAGMVATVNLFGIEFRRNYGIFWEPGILQIYMNLLFFLSLFVIHSKKVALASIFVILTTWSSTGLFTLALQLLYYAYINVMRRRAMYVTATVVPLLATIGMLTITNLDEKISGQDAGSGYARALDTFTAINIAAANPIIGIPLDSRIWEHERMRHRAIIEMEGARDTRDPSDTNSLINYFVFFGVPMGLLILTMLYFQRLVPVHKKLIFIILCVSLSTEPLGFAVFFLMFALSPIVLSDSRNSRRTQYFGRR